MISRTIRSAYKLARSSIHEKFCGSSLLSPCKLPKDFTSLRRFFNSNDKNGNEENLDVSEINFATKMKVLEADQLRFEPTYHKLKKVELPNTYRQIGVPFQELEAFQVDNENAACDDPKLKCYTESWLRVVFPLESKTEVRNFLVNVRSKSVRTGRLLELMDVLAERVGYNWCKSVQADPHLAVVTASVDGIQFFHNGLPIDKDFKMDVISYHQGLHLFYRIIIDGNTH